jgi:hypothetical protein
LDEALADLDLNKIDWTKAASGLKESLEGIITEPKVEPKVDSEGLQNNT